MKSHGVADLAHAGFLAQARGGLGRDLAIERGQRPGEPARKGEAHRLELIGELTHHFLQRGAVDIAHRAHLLGQRGLQIVGQLRQRHIGAFLQQEPHDDRGLLTIVEPIGVRHWRRGGRGAVSNLSQGQGPHLGSDGGRLQAEG